MVAVVEQQGDLRNVDRLGAKVVHVVVEPLNQALVIGDIGFRAVREKRQSQRIDCQMPFNPIGGFVATESFRLSTGSARIFHRLGVDDEPSRPLRFFFHVAVLARVMQS